MFRTRMRTSPAGTTPVEGMMFHSAMSARRDPGGRVPAWTALVSKQAPKAAVDTRKPLLPLMALPWARGAHAALAGSWGWAGPLRRPRTPRGALQTLPSWRRFLADSNGSLGYYPGRGRRL